MNKKPLEIMILAIIAIIMGLFALPYALNFALFPVSLGALVFCVSTLASAYSIMNLKTWGHKLLIVNSCLFLIAWLIASVYTVQGLNTSQEEMKLYRIKAAIIGLLPLAISWFYLNKTKMKN